MYLIQNANLFHDFTDLFVSANDIPVSPQEAEPGIFLYQVSAGDTLKLMATNCTPELKPYFTGFSFIDKSTGEAASFTIDSEGWDEIYIDSYNMQFDIPSDFSSDFEIVSEFEEPTVYTVYFDSMGGSEVESQNVIDGGYATKPEDPTKVGATFGFWSDSLSFVTIFDFNNTPITDYTFLHAGWEYNITFDYNGGTDRQGRTEFTMLTALPSYKLSDEAPNPSKPGFRCIGWKKPNDDTLYTNSDIENMAFSEAITFTAEYGEYCTVQFREGDDTIKTVIVKVGETVSPIEPLHPTNDEGDEFVYWLYDEDPYDFSTPVIDDMILRAVYMRAATSKWLMSLPNCFVGLKSDIDYLPIARVANGTKALAISDEDGEETAYIFHKASWSWIELQHYTVIV